MSYILDVLLRSAKRERQKEPLRGPVCQVSQVKCDRRSIGFASWLPMAALRQGNKVCHAWVVPLPVSCGLSGSYIKDLDHAGHAVWVRQLVVTCREA